MVSSSRGSTHLPTRWCRRELGHGPTSTSGYEPNEAATRYAGAPHVLRAADSANPLHEPQADATTKDDVSGTAQVDVERSVAEQGGARFWREGWRDKVACTFVEGGLVG